MMTYSTGNGSYPLGIAVGDFNNDGRSDIVVANVDTNNIGVLLGYGNGSFATIMTYSTGDNSLPISVAVDDFNNDSRLDIVVANYGTDSVGVLLGYGDGTFSIIKIYSTGIVQSPYPSLLVISIMMIEWILLWLILVPIVLEFYWDMVMEHLEIKSPFQRVFFLNPIA